MQQGLKSNPVLERVPLRHSKSRDSFGAKTAELVFAHRVTKCARIRNGERFREKSIYNCVRAKTVVSEIGASQKVC